MAFPRSLQRVLPVAIRRDPAGLDESRPPDGYERPLV